MRTEHAIRRRLGADARQNALALAAWLRAGGMRFERCHEGYWADKFYWLIKYKDEYVCFIAINGAAYETEPEGWIIWSEDSGSTCFEDFPLDERTREIAWSHVDVCGNCGFCAGGTRKTIFGKEFNNVCRTPMIFANPDAETLECVKSIVEIRKDDIVCKHR